MDSNRSNDLLTPTAARNLGPHPETTLCIASHGVRRWGLQCADASRSRPAAAEIFINQLSKLYYDQPSMPIASHFSPFSQPSHHVPRTSGRARSLVLHAGQSYAPCWSLRRVGLRANNNRTAPHYDLIKWVLAGP